MEQQLVSYVERRINSVRAKFQLAIGNFYRNAKQKPHTAEMYVKEIEEGRAVLRKNVNASYYNDIFSFPALTPVDKVKKATEIVNDKLDDISDEAIFGPENVLKTLKKLKEIEIPEIE